MSLEVFSNEFTIWVPTQNPLAGPCWLLFIFSWWQLFLWMTSCMISLPSLQGLKVFSFPLRKHRSTLPTAHSFCLLSFLFVPEFYFCLFLTSSLQSVWSSYLPFLGSSQAHLWAVEWTRFSVLGITFHTHSSSSFFFFSVSPHFIYFFNFFLLLFVVNFVIHWNETAMGLHVFPIPIPPPTSLSTRSP